MTCLPQCAWDCVVRRLALSIHHSHVCCQGHVAIAEQVSYYLPGYLPSESIFVPPVRVSDRTIMDAYAEQDLAFEGERRPYFFTQPALDNHILLQFLQAEHCGSTLTRLFDHSLCLSTCDQTWMTDAS